MMGAEQKREKWKVLRRSSPGNVLINKLLKYTHNVYVYK